MHFSQLGAAVALVATSQAFLIPPTISADSEIVNTLPFENAINIKDRVIDIDCPGCPIVISDVQGRKHIAEGANMLRLNFSVIPGDEDRLLMNDIQIYPLNPQTSVFEGPPIVDQMIKTPAGKWELAASPEIGFEMVASRPKTPENEELNLLLLKLEVIEVANKFVKPAEAVVVKVLETPSGKLMIGDIEIVTIPHHNSVSEQCMTLLCAWRKIAAAKLAQAKGAIKGCAGKRPGAFTSKVPHGVRPHGRPRPHGPHAHHRHHNRHGSFVRIIRSIVLHVFIPIMIGVVVGVTTSLIGMVFGHMIVFIWRVLFRRGSRAQYSRVASEEDVKDGEETKNFTAPPPSYEDAPAYEEAVVDEKSVQ